MERKQQKKIKDTTKGITLVALVVTIVLNASAWSKLKNTSIQNAN